MKKDYDITRNSILCEAVDRCMKELYEKAQPSADISEYVRKIKSGEITDEEQNADPIYKRHYMSQAEMKYIVDKYHEAYRLDNEFTDSCDLLLKDMDDNYTVDKYIEEHTDENGDYHPGYRGYEHMPTVEEQVKLALKTSDIDNPELAKNIADIFRNFIKNRRDFYRFDRDGEKFNYSVYLGASPTSAKDQVIEYWKAKGVDVEIKDRNPEYFWYHDKGYSDDDIREEFELPDDANVD